MLALVAATVLAIRGVHAVATATNTSGPRSTRAIRRHYVPPLVTYKYSIARWTFWTQSHVGREMSVEGSNPRRSETSRVQLDHDAVLPVIRG